MQYGIYQIKNITTNQRMSEETQFFSLDLYVNGRKFCAVSNDGRGGCHRVHPYPPFTYKDIEEHTALMKADDFLVDSEFEPFDSAVSTMLVLHETQKTIARLAKTKVLMLENNDLMTLAVNKGIDPKSVLDKVRQKYPESVVLNDMDVLEAAKLVVKAERIKINEEFASYTQKSENGLKP